MSETFMNVASIACFVAISLSVAGFTVVLFREVRDMWKSKKQGKNTVWRY